MKKHYIAMSGEHGCLPDYCCSCETKADAVGVLATLFDDVRGVKAALRRSDYCELSDRLTYDGNTPGAEYCEIVPCDCNDPESHNDN